MGMPFKMHTETKLEKWRRDTFWQKEPETIAWIDAFDGGIFFDVGANVGVYSLYCAVRHPEMGVIALEPDPENYYALTRNIRLNGFDNIFAMPFALYTHLRFARISLSGDAGATGAAVGCGNYPVVSIGLLNLLDVERYIDVTYMKIDIDGHELPIIQYGETFLAATQCRSILLECGLNDKAEILRIMAGCGWTPDERFNSMTPHSSQRRRMEKINVENIVFRQTEPQRRTETHGR